MKNSSYNAKLFSTFEIKKKLKVVTVQNYYIFKKKTILILSKLELKEPENKL